MSSPRSVESPHPGQLPASLLPARLPPSLRSPAWQAPSPPAPPSPGGQGVVPQSPWRPASLPAPRPSSRLSQRLVRAGASSGSSPHNARPASGLLLLPRSASPVLGPVRGPLSRSPRVSGSPSSSSPSGRWSLSALQARSPPRGARGLHLARLDLAPPGRAGSASCPLLQTSSASRRGAHYHENLAYLWEKALVKPPSCPIIDVRGHSRETCRWAGGAANTPAPDHRR
jgi:hypothetical protein